MDHDVRPITIAEQAEAAARRFIATGEPQHNPHAGLPGEQRWRSVYERWLLALTADEGSEGSA